MSRRVRTTGHLLSRRSFLAGAAAVSGALAAPARTIARGAPSDTLLLAAIGVGGRGGDNLRDLKDTGARIVALCDVDAQQAAESFKAYPDAVKYTDWRRLLERERNIDGVVISTPDHNHAVIACAAMQYGKHVYSEKPLARSIWEARQMASVAATNHVVTQMGIQGHAFEGSRRAVEVIRSGVLGDVRALHVWTDRPAGWWPQGVQRPADTPPVPTTLNWDVWLGPAPNRPFNPAYVPFKWRGFCDFGTGAIGDMGIHNLDTAYWGLELGTPTHVAVKDYARGPGERETYPLWSIIELQFPARGAHPPVTMTWYDGGKLPPQDLFHGEKLITHDGGSLIVGTKGTLFTRTWHGGENEKDMFVMLPRKQFEGYQPPEPTLPRVKSHHQEWVDACRGHGKTLAPYSYAAVLTESLLLGNVALRSGKAVEWDPVKMLVTNNPVDAAPFVKPEFRAGWSL